MTSRVLPFLLAIAALGAGAASNAGAAQREREPNNTSRQANGPIGAGGIVLRDRGPKNLGWFYFKVAAGQEVTLVVTDLNGRCGVAPDQDFVETATAPEGELHYFETVGGEAGSVETFKVDAVTRTRVIAGYLRPNIGDRANENNRGCSELVQANPASALVVIRSSRDRRELRNPAIADQ